MVLCKPAIFLVLEGQKALHLPEQRFLAKAGDLLIVPAGRDVWVAKTPDSQTGSYLGLGVMFAPELFAQLKQTFAASLGAFSRTARWQAPASDALLLCLGQWLEWCQHAQVPAQAQQHRLVELLWLLANEGLAGNLLKTLNPSWRERVAQVFTVDPSRDWRIQDLCHSLFVSESVLRRHLQAEGTSFRSVLEETRLMAGMLLLQETGDPINQVALAVGYQSQSRFAERFKRRFGMTPGALRRTMDPVAARYA